MKSGDNKTLSYWGYYLLFIVNHSLMHNDGASECQAWNCNIKL